MAAHSPPEQVVKTLHINQNSQSNPRQPTIEDLLQISTRTPETPDKWTSAFWRYPEQQGWISNNGHALWSLSSNQEETAARAQEWLYFHLLDSILGVGVPIHTMLRVSPRSGQMIIDSSALPEVLQDWEPRKRRADGCEKYETSEESFGQTAADEGLSLLTHALQECNNLDEQHEPSRTIALSIRILIEMLAKAISPFSKAKSVERWTIWNLGPTPLLSDRMAGAGWCRFRIAKLWYQHHPSTMYYISSLPKRVTFGGSKHDTCTTERCTSATVDPITYEPKHRKTCSSNAANLPTCSMVGVDTACIANIILQDSFPLIEIQVHTDAVIELKVHKYTLGLRYVAFSHVWSGGLGNAKANSMRWCQLGYLHKLLHDLRESGDDDLDRRHGSRKIDDSIDDLRVRFGFARKEMPLLLWIDTLCIPVGRQHSIAYTKTLNRMAQIYVTAQCTVVLDPELQEMNHRPMQVEQAYAHILCSSWQSRSWTFQEVRPLTRWFQEMPVLAKIRYSDPRELMSNLEDWQNFALAWNGLRDRSTTKPEDLYGIIAVVVDLSAGDILKLQREERLKAIFRSQTTLPLPLLYQSSPKILDSKGRSTWAPSGIVGDRLNLHSGYVTVGTEGLSIEPGRWINMNRPQAILLAAPSTGNNWLEVEVTENGTRHIIELVTCAQMESQQSSLCCVYDNTLLRHTPEGGTFAPGVCLSIKSLEGHVYRTSYLCSIKKVPVSSASIAGSLGITGQLANLNAEHVHGSLLNWEKHGILVETDWPSPLPHVSKRSLSKRVIIRNTSNWIELSSVGLISGPYLAGIIACAVHRRNAIASKLFWLCLSRWLSLLVEAAWALASLAFWDRHRTMDWADRLYGTTQKPRLQRIKHILQYPAFLARVPPLAAAAVFLGLFYSHRHDYLRVFAVVLFSEVGLSLSFTLFVISFIFLVIARDWYQPITRTFFSDLPESEMTDAQLRVIDEKWSTDVDQTYRIAIVAWRFVNYIRRKEANLEG
ncbi:MAG: hypothetical protein LQ348_000985 [Seirophora lacunosa]|nr:MAG: hypothetical protein LQ348_000985 [Seirophora lacunosa]